MNRGKIIHYIKSKPKLYYMIKCVRGFGDKTFIKDVIRMNECDLILNFQKLGELYPHDNIYFIRNDSNVRGFFSLLFLVLDALSIAKEYHLTPVIEYGPNTLYYQGCEINGSTNPFEYFFQPVSHIKIDEISQCSRVLFYKDGHRNSDYNLTFSVASKLVADNNDSHESDYVIKRAHIYNEYIHLKPEVNEYINSNIKNIIGNHRVLGVHVRGTDFNKGYLNHATAVSTEQYLSSVEKEYEEGTYDYIFLATDEEKTVDIFRKRFGGNLLYYDDILRSTTGEALHFSENTRPNNKYLLGLEVLRDAMTLSECCGFVAGLSNVSLAVRVLKIAHDEEFDYLKIIDNGFNSKGKILKKST